LIHRFLTTNWLGLLIGALLAAGLALIPILMLNARLDARTAERDAARLQVGSLSSSLELQNKGIEALVKASQANREVYLAGLEAANRRAIRLEVDAERILALPSPTTPTEQCEAAHALLLAD
jgi:hypothetical protein